jgi:uncharacterized membrane protein YhhN
MFNSPAVITGLAVSAVASGLYGLYFLNRPESLLRALVKAAAVGAPAAGFALAGAHPVLVLALGASALGDFLLAFDKRWTLALGILAFLIAQLAYIAGFFGLWLFAGDLSPIWPRHLMQGAIGAFALGALVWLWRDLKAMTIPVIFYMAAIAGMAAVAVRLDWSAWAAMVGALLWLASDTILAAELFKLPADAPARKFTTPLVWWTYYFAQALIVIGIFQAVRAMV